jgi:Xaa-Pro aminopeptidase
VTWPRDDAKLDRVRAMMSERDLDALVVRAPDNVLYLTNFWAMKGYDIAVFPVEGEPTLVALEPSLDDARRMAWTEDVRLFGGYDERDPRPPTARALEVAQAVVQEKGYERIGLELSLGTQAADRMVGEPTTYTLGFFQGFPGAADATMLLNEARAIKTAQEVERMRLANELCSGAMEDLRERIRPGMTEAEVAAMWEGYVHSVGTGYKGKVDLAYGFTLIWAGPGIRTFTATGSRPVLEDEPTLFEIWVCADGYWADHTKNLCPGMLKPEYDRLLELLLGLYHEAVGIIRPGVEMAELDKLIRARITEGGYPGQPSHPICHGVGARAHEWPYPHQAAPGEFREGMVLAIEPGIYWEGGGGLRVEDNFLITADGTEQLGTFPDDFRGL